VEYPGKRGYRQLRDELADIPSLREIALEQSMCASRSANYDPVNNHLALLIQVQGVSSSPDAADVSSSFLYLRPKYPKAFDSF
jgi:hypothetical protein